MPEDFTQHAFRIGDKRLVTNEQTVARVVV